MHPDFALTVYLLASQRNGTLYVGVTSDLLTRVHKHRNALLPGFTRDYGVKLLVWFEGPDLGSRFRGNDEMNGSRRYRF